MFSIRWITKTLKENESKNKIKEEILNKLEKLFFNKTKEISLENPQIKQDKKEEVKKRETKMVE